MHIHIHIYIYINIYWYFWREILLVFSAVVITGISGGSYYWYLGAFISWLR